MSSDDEIDEVVFNVELGSIQPANPAPVGYATYEDAVAALRASLADGETLLLHAEDCLLTKVNQECTCEPIHIVASPN